jgi:trans-AT polyketide synthase/acyltransferase/oxidoreductase domain-containing protein
MGNERMNSTGGRAYLFPGQGSQKRGMGAEVFEQFPELLACADEEMAISMKDLCLRDPDGLLDQTQYTQPALYVVNALMFLARLAEDGRLPRYVAGHSLGEYSALFAAGVFDFITGLRLVKERARLMAKAHGGAMVVVVGLSVSALRSALDSVGLESVDIANLNSANQIVISGPERDLAEAPALMERAGAQLAKRLNVSGAFHSRYMQAAGSAFTQFLDGFEWQPPRIAVLSNVTARPYEQQDLKINLARQITHAVRWHESVHWLLSSGAECVEVGPGNVLTGLLRRISAEFNAGKTALNPAGAPA